MHGLVWILHLQVNSSCRMQSQLLKNIRAPVFALQDSGLHINIMINQVGKQTLISCITSSVNRAGQAQFLVTESLDLRSVPVCKPARNQPLTAQMLASLTFQVSLQLKTVREPLILSLWTYLEEGQIVKVLWYLLKLAAGFDENSGRAIRCHSPMPWD